jgi:hypothetical protein
VGRYETDVLAAGWRQAGKPVTKDVIVKVGLVVEEPTSGFVGEVKRWENGLVVLEDRRQKRRSFPMGPGFWIDGKPVALVHPPRGPVRKTHTASGSRIGEREAAKVARPARIYVEGRHDAELVEKIWGDDLRHVGVVVEYLGGIDDLPSIVADFDPCPDRRLGVLVDHLVSGSKESRISDAVKNTDVLIVGHPFIDIWQAVKPGVVGLESWPEIPRSIDWKSGISQALGRPANSQTDIAETWKWILGQVTSWTDLAPELPQAVERLIDFVT